MNVRANPSKSGGTAERRILVISTLYLVVTFLRGFGPAGARPGNMVTALRFLFELAMAIGVVGLGIRVVKSVRRDGGGVARWVTLMVVGIFAALGVFIIRLGDVSGLTPPPRPTPSRVEFSKEPSGVPEEMSRRFRELMAEQKKREESRASASPKRSPN
jgi:hypothetical protein